MALLSEIVTPNSEPYRQILISTDRSVRLDHWHLTQDGVKWGGGQHWSVHKETLHGGKQEGVELVMVDNGALQLTVVPTRGMGILEVRGKGGVRLGWNSPVKEVVHPRLINLHSRGGLGWLEGFNEWLARCGLESAGHPGTDRFITNTGQEAEMDLTLHGKIANIPASEVEVVIDNHPPHRIRVRGRVDERMLYGPKLALWTEISTIPNSLSFRIEDVVTNHGAFDQEFQLIYHTNYGPPLLGNGSKFVGALEQVTPFNDHAVSAVDHFDVYQEPTKGFVEQVYCLVPRADDQDQTKIMLRNAAGDQGVSMTYSVAALPYLTLWKNTNAQEEGYVTGLEPGTGFPYNRRVERRFGRVPRLTPGEQRTFAIDVALLPRAKDVQEVERSIGDLQRDKARQINRQPIKTD